MKLFLTLIMVYVLLGAIIVAAAYYATGGQAEPFSKVAGVGLTFLTALLAAVGAFTGVVKQAATAKEIEALKTSFTKEIEALKLRLSERTKAFNDLSRCAYGYYHALAELEVGVFNRIRVETADAEMQKVVSQKNHLHESCREAWERFWQEAYNTAREAKDLSPQQYPELWRVKIKTLARWLTQFTENCKDKHQLGAVQED